MIRKLPGLALILALLAAAPVAYALNGPWEMLPNKAEEARAEAIGRQLRCMVCQNESIEDSGAALAADLRAIVRRKVAAGESNRQIMAFMVKRYGNFVLLRPPFDPLTALLWTMPLLAPLAGFAVVLLLRRRHAVPPAPLSDAEQARLADLLPR
ncbi:MAG TPA: cytochrome c-type biogenesis protein [Acetobacteraceae bacterium]|nr:cytochrome c-type biogenesis protein [Acetobacteraceae bacterium]